MIVSEAQKAAVLQWFLDPMQALFQPPFHLKETGPMTLALKQYIEALSRFKEAELDAGWKRLRESHKGRWPDIAVCVEACHGAKAVTKAAQRKAEEPRACTLDELMRSPTGQAAIRAGRAHDLEIVWRTSRTWPEDPESFSRPVPAEKCLAVTIRMIEQMREPDRSKLMAQAEKRRAREAELAAQYG